MKVCKKLSDNIIQDVVGVVVVAVVHSKIENYIFVFFVSFTSNE
jgi:hypothetical protein